MSQRMLRGYTRGPDGLFRKRITFARPDSRAPANVVQEIILVRNQSGRLIRGQKTGNRIRLANTTA